MSLTINLDGKTAIVTGGGQGLGAETARTLHQAGARVAVTYFEDGAGLNREKAAALVAELGGNALAVEGDVRQAASAERAVAQVVETFGRLDILVNNAGILRDRSLAKMSFDEWQSVIDTNLTGYYRTIKRCLPGMIERRWGRIVNIASTAANVGAKDNAAYCSSKAGILGLTRCVALEGAPHGITCNAINPGFVNTRMLRSTLKTMKARDGDTRSEEEMIAAIAQSYPQKRIIEPEEIGNLAAFLCHDAQRLAHRRAVAVGLDQGGHHGFDVVEARAAAEVFVSPCAIFEKAQLGRGERELFGQFCALRPNFLGHTLESMLHRHARLNTEKEQVKAIRPRATDRGLTLLRPVGEQEQRQIGPD